MAFEIIPRKKDDQLDLQWDAQQAAEEDMETILALLKEEEKSVKDISKVEKVEASGGNEGKEGNESDHSKENYMIKTLRKIP